MVQRVGANEHEGRVLKHYCLYLHDRKGERACTIYAL